MALGLLFLWMARTALPPFILALLIAVVVDPAIRHLEERGWPRSRSVPLLFLLILVAITAMLTWGVPLLYHQVTDLIEKAPYYIQEAQLQADRALKSKPFQRLPDNFHVLLDAQIQLVSGRITSAIPDLLSRVTGLFGATVSHLFWLIIALLATYYFMLDLPKILISVFRLVPIRHRSRVELVSSDVAGVFSAYLRGLLIVSGMYGVVVWLVLIPFGIPNALALGALAGLLYMVPYLGALVTTIVVGLVAFFATPVTTTLIVLGVMLLIHYFFDYLVTPRILGGQVGLHPLASLFAMVTGGTMFGIVGIILSVPVAASMVIILKNLYPRLLRPMPSLDSLQGEPSEKADGLDLRPFYGKAAERPLDIAPDVSPETPI